MFKFLCHRVPLVHLALPDHVMVTKLDKTAQLQPERALSHDFNAVTLEHLYRLRDAFSMTSPSHSARTPLRATMNRCNLRRLYA